VNARQRLVSAALTGVALAAFAAAELIPVWMGVVHR
jgi:hypothetical protein